MTQPIDSLVTPLARLQAMPAPVPGTVIFLPGRITDMDGAEGWFLWRATEDREPLAKLDPRQGVYVRPRWRGQGVWERIRTPGTLMPTWFGADRLGGKDSGEETHAAFQACLNWAAQLEPNTAECFITIQVPPGIYRLADSLRYWAPHNKDWSARFTLEGIGSASSVTLRAERDDRPILTMGTERGIMRTVTIQRLTLQGGTDTLTLHRPVYLTCPELIFSHTRGGHSLVIRGNGATSAVNRFPNCLFQQPVDANSVLCDRGGVDLEGCEIGEAGGGITIVNGGYVRMRGGQVRQMMNRVTVPGAPMPGNYAVNVNHGTFIADGVNVSLPTGGRTPEARPDGFVYVSNANGEVQIRNCPDILLEPGGALVTNGHQGEGKGNLRYKSALIVEGNKVRWREDEAGDLYRQLGPEREAPRRVHRNAVISRNVVTGRVRTPEALREPSLGNDLNGNIETDG